MKNLRLVKVVWNDVMVVNCPEGLRKGEMEAVMPSETVTIGYLLTRSNDVVRIINDITTSRDDCDALNVTVFPAGMIKKMYAMTNDGEKELK